MGRSWRGALLLTWVALLYAPSLKNGFTYDDGKVIAGASALLNHPSLLPRLFSTDYFRLSNEATFRPIVTLTYMVDWQIGAGSPWAFHLQSLLWHLAAVGCLLLLLKKLGASATVGYASAAFYGVHPALTEAVDSIAFREDVLVTTFGLLGLLFMIGSWPRRRGVRLVVGSACFAAAMLSKESGVVFLFLLPLTHWVMARQTVSLKSWWPTRYRSEYLSLSVCTASYLIVRFVLLPSQGEYAKRIGDSLARSLATGTVAVGDYLRLLVYPSALCADYRGVVSFVTSGADWRFWVSCRRHSWAHESCLDVAPAERPGVVGLGVVSDRHLAGIECHPHSGFHGRALPAPAVCRTHRVCHEFTGVAGAVSPCETAVCPLGSGGNPFRDPE